MNAAPRKHHGYHRVPGFTLMEMMMVMLVLTLLLGAVFGIVRGTLELSDEMTQAQAADTRLHGFIQYCNQTFRHLPAGAQLRHRVEKSGNHYLSELAIVGGRSVFPGSSSEGNEVYILQSEEQPGGYLRVVLRAVSQEELIAWENGDHKVGKVLPLLKDVALIEWRFFNSLSGEWEIPWNDLVSFRGVSVDPGAAEDEVPVGAAPSRRISPPDPSRESVARPGLVELRLQIAGDSAHRWVLWTPPAQLP